MAVVAEETAATASGDTDGDKQLLAVGCWLLALKLLPLIAKRATADSDVN